MLPEKDIWTEGATCAKALRHTGAQRVQATRSCGSHGGGRRRCGGGGGGQTDQCEALPREWVEAACRVRAGGSKEAGRGWAREGPLGHVHVVV